MASPIGEPRASNLWLHVIIKKIYSFDLCVVGKPLQFVYSIQCKHELAS